MKAFGTLFVGLIGLTLCLAAIAGLGWLDMNGPDWIASKPYIVEGLKGPIARKDSTSLGLILTGMLLVGSIIAGTAYLIYEIQNKKDS